MKKKIVLMVSIIIYLCSIIGVEAAKIGDIINYTLYTDIVASINNYNIESFNIDGYTAVVAEDLRNYGFNVNYVENRRALYIERSSSDVITSTYEAPEADKSKVGKKVHNVLYTDIVTYINGKKVTSYNINGRTIIYFDDLKVFGSVTYNNSTRKIDLTINDGLETKPVYLIDVCEPYQLACGELHDDKTFRMGGTEYSKGLRFGGVYFTTSDGPYALFNMGGRYSEISFELAFIDGMVGDWLNPAKKCTITFWADGVKVDAFDVHSQDFPMYKTVKINNCRQLKITASNYKAGIGLGNITVK